ncbi:hypothetical protein [Paenibacillus hubeiensis]|uniref:hypothetical protein n=1 Tax=Paenibacillus hubeiensis TaxID=3077330 RepID=UPI0031BB4175
MINESIPNLGEPYKLRMELDVEAKLNAVMALTGEKKPDALRRLLRDAVERELAEQTLGYVLPQIRRAVSESIRPTEDRMAKIASKAAIASGTAMYTNLELLGQMGKKDIREIHKTARVKAVSFLRNKEDAVDTEN